MLVAACCLGAGCLSDTSGTGGRSVLFELGVASPDYMAEEPAFTTETGWEVHLEQAVIAMGPFYLWENPSPQLAEPADPAALDVVGWLGDLIVPTAFAHPGDEHFNGGQLRGEYLGQYAFDLTRPTAMSLGVARGIAGDVRSLTVIVDPPSDVTFGAVDELQGHHAYVIGTAIKDGEVVEFEGGLDIPAEGAQREVQGVPIELDLDDGGTLVVGVNPRVWFAEARFETLEEPGESGRYVITEQSQVGVAWFIGARSASAFYASWQPNADLPLVEGAQQ